MNGVPEGARHTAPPSRISPDTRTRYIARNRGARNRLPGQAMQDKREAAKLSMRLSSVVADFAFLDAAHSRPAISGSVGTVVAIERLLGEHLCL